MELTKIEKRLRAHGVDIESAKNVLLNKEAGFFISYDLNKMTVDQVFRRKSALRIALYQWLHELGLKDWYMIKDKRSSISVTRKAVPEATKTNFVQEVGEGVFAEAFSGDMSSIMPTEESIREMEESFDFFKANPEDLGKVSPEEFKQKMAELKKETEEREEKTKQLKLKRELEEQAEAVELAKAETVDNPKTEITKTTKPKPLPNENVIGWFED